MSDNRTLVRITYDWRRLRLPTDHFRAGRRNAATHDLELVVDHLKSSVEGLLGGWGEGKEWDYAALIQSRLRNVEQADHLLAGIAPVIDRRPYQQYLRATAFLLGVLRDTIYVENWCHAAGHDHHFQPPRQS